MRFKDFLKVVDLCGIKIICYLKGEEEPIYTGNYLDVPWWLADLYLDDTFEEEPVSYRNDLGEKYNHKPGFVICLREEK